MFLDLLGGAQWTGQHTEAAVITLQLRLVRTLALVQEAHSYSTCPTITAGWLPLIRPWLLASSTGRMLVETGWVRQLGDEQCPVELSRSHGLDPG